MAPGNQHAADRGGRRARPDRAPVLIGVAGTDHPPALARSARTGFPGFESPTSDGAAVCGRFKRRGRLLRGSTGRVPARGRGWIDRRGASIATGDPCHEPAMIRGMPLHARPGGCSVAGDRRGIDPRVGKIATGERCRDPARPRIRSRLATLGTSNLSVDARGIDHDGARIAGGTSDFASIQQNI
jgi:hypothetical protein